MDEAPIIFVTGLVGAYATNGRAGDVVVAGIFGVIGYGMKKYGFPRVSVVIGLILGPIAEASYFQLTYSGQSLWSRPIAMSLLALTVLMLSIPIVKPLLQRRAG